MDSMAAIRQTFFQECEEQLAELETGLLALEEGQGDDETVNAVFRAVHSIKGGAGAFGLEDLVRFAHTFETTLDGLRNGTLESTSALMRLLLRSADLLADLVRVSRDGGDVEQARIDHMGEELARMAGLPAAAPVQAAAPEPEPAFDDAPQADAFGFAPVQISFDTLVGEDEEVEAAPQSFRIRFRPRPELYAKANDAVRLLRELARLGEARVTCDWSDVPLLTELDPEGAYLDWTVELQTQADEETVREIFEFAELDCDLSVENVTETLSDDEAAAAVQALLAQVAEEKEAPAAPPQDLGEAAPAQAAVAPAAAPRQPAQAAQQQHQQQQAQAQATIRVDLDRVDRMIDLVSELVINQSMLSQRLVEAGMTRLSEVANALDDTKQLIREVQDSVMAIRAQPVRPIFQRMSRVVRELADMTGKSVRLVTDGEGCEIDKTVIERLSDPLTHMIRNAVDHGLEKPEDRLKAGKPEQGVVRMIAAHRSGRVVIEVSDDGAGIDRARVRAIAVKRGIVAPDAVLSDAEVDDLIFAPGFSTASSVSDISGRGVGMDVVRRSIQALGGRIAISSRPGEGSTFSLSLPLTLAVLDGMVVNSAGQTMVIPLNAIVETLQPRQGEVHSLGESARVVAIRGSFIPLIDTGRAMGYRTEEADPLKSVAVLVETENQSRCALMVDAIVGQQQVVIKSLETNYGHVDGVAAATILGDGRVAVILDIDAIVSGSRTEAPRADNTNQTRSAA